MKVLLIGSGGREHALAQGLLRDPQLEELHVAPGNPGIASIATCHPIVIEDHAAVVLLAQTLDIDLVVVGPEKPLVDGLADRLRKAKFAVFGPSAVAAQLEGSKDFAKQVMHDAGVPTSRSFTCTTRVEVESALDTFGAPYVVKHDGLAAGKGVVVTDDRNEALAHAELSPRVVIEEYLDGPEISLFGISDGKRILAMQPAQDFKRIFDGDLGPNTGGMGAYSPLPWAPHDIVQQTLIQVLQPTIAEMKARDTPFIGLLYAGLALTKKGIRVIEFNARFGDPETQVLLPRLKTPLATLLYSAAIGNLKDAPALDWSEDAAVTVVLASEGYPDAPKIGEPITGVTSVEGVTVFHAGTTMKDGLLHSAGGRVLAVTGIGTTLVAARAKAYQAIAAIGLRGSQYRTDIALAASTPPKVGEN
ncbi:MAG: phosphoribosylamine--glycine ligase [Actinomycetota bacterium]